jgi:hypothetical protein
MLSDPQYFLVLTALKPLIFLFQRGTNVEQKSAFLRQKGTLFIQILLFVILILDSKFIVLNAFAFMCGRVAHTTAAESAALRF